MGQFRLALLRGIQEKHGLNVTALYKRVGQVCSLVI